MEWSMMVRKSFRSEMETAEGTAFDLSYVDISSVHESPEIILSIDNGEERMVISLTRDELWELRTMVGTAYTAGAD
jgi:hypothetical protein